MIYIWLVILSLGSIFLFLVIGGLMESIDTLQKAVKNLQDTISILQTNHSVLNEKIIPNLEKIKQQENTIKETA